eukprot:479575_1
MDGSIAKGVRRGWCDEKGRALYATRAFSEGELIFRERPRVAMQSLHNNQEVLVCRRCLSFVGCVRTQLLLLRFGRQECLSLLNNESFNYQDNAVVQCNHLCGEVYCSSSCRDLHWVEGHCLLCVGDVEERDAGSHPLVKLKLLAAEQDEIMILVADVLASLAVNTERKAFETDTGYGPFVKKLWWECALDGGRSDDNTMNK